MVLDLDKVAMDLDGTILRSNSFACKLINYRCGARLAYDDIQDYDWWDSSGWRAIFNETYDIIDDFGLRTAIEPYDEKTSAVLYDLMNGYHHQGRVTGPLHIVTYNNPEAEQSIREWLRLRAGVVGREKVEVHCLGRPSKADDHNIPDKAELDFQVFVDDNPGLAIEIGENHPEKVCLMANTGLNEDVNEEDYQNVIRWHSWVQLENLLFDIGRHEHDLTKALDDYYFTESVAELPD